MKTICFLFVGLVVGRDALNFLPAIGDTLSTSAGDVRVLDVLGKGSFGRVFQAEFTDSHRGRVALKVARNDKKFTQVFKSPIPEDYMQITHEVRMMRMMESEVGFPKIHAVNFNGKYKYYLMDLLGRSLGQLVRPDHRLRTKVLIPIGLQIIDRLEAIHRKGYLMYDIHPGNFVLKDQRVYAIDLGMALPYRDSFGQHLPYTWSQLTSKNMYWTSREDGLNHSVSRRDDLERFLYMVVHLLIGKLPWKREEDGKIASLKWDIEPSEICRGKAKWLIPAFEYVFSLEFEQNPDYTILVNIFRSRLAELSRSQ